MYAKVPPHQGGTSEAFNPPADAVDVRDLDREGVMGYIAIDKAWSSSSASFSVTQSIFTLQDENKKLKDRVGRLEEVVADFIRRAA